jgi:hypothetical protein
MDSLVTAIMPTRGRERFEWACRAIECFERQTYDNKELIILDHGRQPTFVDAPTCCQYWRLSPETVMNIPEKRNMLCRLAHGRYIFHLDSDDWSAPSRMQLQVELLETSRKSVCGFSSMLFYVETTGECFEYRSHPHYALGSSLCYRRDWWRDHRWHVEFPIGSDNRFVQGAVEQSELITVTGETLMIARIHATNTSSKNTKSSVYTRADASRIPAAFHAPAFTSI